MTRTTDPDPEPWKPLGERIATPPKPPPGSKPVPNSDQRYGVVIGPDGKLKTTRMPTY